MNQNARFAFTLTVAQIVIYFGFSVGLAAGGQDYAALAFAFMLTVNALCIWYNRDWIWPKKSLGAICGKCGGLMIFNVPRLGERGGYIHRDTGKFDCE